MSNRRLALIIFGIPAAILFFVVWIAFGFYHAIAMMLILPYLTVRILAGPRRHYYNPDLDEYLPDRRRHGRP